MAIIVTCTECGAQLKAPDSAAGKIGTCPHCGTRMKLEGGGAPDAPAAASDPMQSPPSPFDEPGASNEPVEPEIYEPELVDPVDALAAASEPEHVFESSTPGEPARRPCPACGEMIPVSALKCRFCGELFDPALKREARKSSIDDNMTTGDWVVAILCSGIGCIVGIVWMIQGKKKGGKMLLLSILFGFLWNVIVAIIESAAQGPRY